jgi:hypothetical protein
MTFRRMISTWPHAAKGYRPGRTTDCTCRMSSGEEKFIEKACSCCFRPADCHACHRPSIVRRRRCGDRTMSVQVFRLRWLARRTFPSTNLHGQILSSNWSLLDNAKSTAWTIDAIVRPASLISRAARGTEFGAVKDHGVLIQ